MEKLNLAISLLAIIFSVIAIAFGWRQHSIQSTQRKREIISDLIVSLKKFSHTYEVVMHERTKTGRAICDEEEHVYSTLKAFSEISDDLIKKMAKSLTDKKFILKDHEIGQALIVKQHSESLTIQLEFIHDRFKRFNDNRISELREPFQKLSAIFENLGRAE